MAKADKKVKRTLKNMEKENQPQWKKAAEKNKKLAKKGK